MAIIDFKDTKCKHCYKCVRNCEVKAIMIKDGRAEIMPENCILCGKCLQICPQSAKRLVSDLGKVKAYILSGQKVVASIAPSYMGLVKYKTLGQVKAALKKLGFADVRETAEGAAMVTEEYDRLLQEGKMENIITTCCPSVNDLIEIYYPQLVPYMAPVVSPMIAHGRLLKNEYGKDVKVVFVGPCISKKKEAQDPRHADCVDAVLDFNDIQSWLADKDICVEECEDEPFERIDPRVNRLYPVSGGVIHSVLSAKGRVDSYRKFYVHGMKECVALCESLSRGEIKGCFIEINNCAGGCIQGPTVEAGTVSRFKVKLDMEDAVKKDPADAGIVAQMMAGVQMGKAFEDRSFKGPMPSEAEIRAILRETGKSRPEDELNCGACGYPTCREKAIAVLQKKAELNMCIPFMHSKSESFANLVMETSPNIVLIVDKDMKIMEYSAVGEKYFGKTRTEALDMYLYEFIDPVDFQWVYDTHQNIRSKRVKYEEYHLSTLQNIVYIEKEDVVLATFIDITKEEEQARADYDKKLETVDLAQRVIHKQMMVAQQIAGLLGETTADTKTTLTKLCQSMLEDGNESEVR